MLASLLSAALLSAAPMVWTLYERSGAITLAHETPDSDALDAVIECRTGSGAVTLSFYGADRPPADASSARLASAAATATTMVEGGGGLRPYTRVAFRTDHPVFQAFARTGALKVEAGGREKAVAIDPEKRGELSRFVKSCG